MNAVAEVDALYEAQWVTFYLEGECYGINVMQVQEVLRVSDIAPVPGAPEYVMGIINLRGNVVSVLDTRNRFGLPSRETDESTRIIIVEMNQQTVGIIVDSVGEVVEVQQDEVGKSPNVGNEESARYIHGIVSREGFLLILVELSRLLDQDNLEEFL